MADPRAEGGVQLTETEPSRLATAETRVGASGTVGMTTELDEREGSLVPNALVAVNENT